MQYRETGTGNAPVLLIHGWMVTGRVWDWLLPLLGERRVIVPELWHESTPTLDRLLDSLRALCSRLQLNACHLVGHSMGGQLATLLAAAAPERFSSLTLLNPVPVDGMALPPDIQTFFRRAGGNAEALGRILDMSRTALAPDRRERLLAEALRLDPAIVTASFDAWHVGQETVDLAAVTMPATVLATDDPFLPPAFLETQVVQRLPNARLVSLSGCGHYPQVEAPRATAQEMTGTWE